MKPVLIIPAAGSGTRLHAAVPKVLFPVNGKPMIDYVLALYAPVVAQFILVLQPAVAHAVQRHCRRHALPIEYALQDVPTGMLDALLIPQERVRCSPWTRVWMTWCDQVAVHPTTVQHLAALSTQEPDTAVILPTVTRTQPYVHLVRNAQGAMINVLHRREGDAMPEVGESDMGLFCLSRTAYLDFLSDFAREGGQGSLTREKNFLPFIPWLSRRARVRTFAGQDAMEAVGINTADDLHQVETYFLQREKATCHPSPTKHSCKRGLHPDR
jgi:bifunctional UDP-N-acetylglucosamine pyrophosphorylase/glucosamine-1-phosphate N-acetyltransferase